MKKLLLLCTVLIRLTSTSQITITTEGFEACGWNTETEKYDYDCFSDDKESSRFTFNKDVTMFVHTTPEMTSTYYIDSTDHQLEEERGLWVYFVTSDVGNRYLYFFDLKYSEVRAIPFNGSYIITATIKQLWDDTPMESIEPKTNSDD